MKNRPAEDQRGFTLLEVMVALSIIIIVLTALLGTQSQGLSLAIESKFKTTAALLAREKMSQLEMMNDDEISSDSGEFDEDFSAYQWSLEVEQEEIPGIENAQGRLLRLDLTVSLGDDDKYQYTIRQYRFVNARQ
jgi:general secretion pathway protein I